MRRSALLREAPPAAVSQVSRSITPPREQAADKLVQETQIVDKQQLLLAKVSSA